LLDRVWYVDAPRDVLRRRLIERQVAGGRSEEDAVRHVDESDLRNAELVARTRQLADRIIQSGLPAGAGPA
jgi:pantothenate kinase